MFLDLGELALKNIIHRKRRSWLTIIGILIGIAAVVGLVSLSQGLQDSIESEFESIGSDKIFVQPGGNAQQQRLTGTTAELTDDELETVARTRGVEDVAGVVFSSVQIDYRDETKFGSLIGTPTGEKMEIVMDSWAMEIGEGRELRSTDTSGVVVGSQFQDGTFQEDVSIRSKLEIEGEEFRVVGILEPTGDPFIDSAVLMPQEPAREVTGNEESYGYIITQLQEGFEAEEVRENMEENLRQERGLEEGEEDFTIQTPQDLISSFNNILSLVRGVVIGIASISLLVGGVGIMNTMYTSVTERTREIGVMKSIGATNRQIMGLFLLESGIIGLVGGLIGVTLGISLSYIAAYFATQAIQIQIDPFIGWQLIIGSLLFAFVVGTVSGVLPARKAARLQPADALRYE